MGLFLPTRNIFPTHYRQNQARRREICDKAGTFISNASRNIALTELHAIAEKDLPGEAQQALVKFYHCCANINKKDNSTFHRYRLSDHRLKNVKGNFRTCNLRMRARPFSSCISFAKCQVRFPRLSFISSVLVSRSWPRRYDAGIRHCVSCPRFEGMAAYYCEEGETAKKANPPLS